MKINSCFLFIILFCIATYCDAQNSLIDSLQNRLKNRAVSATEKFRIYNELTELYRINDKYSLAETTLQQQLLLAKNVDNYTEQVKALVQRGVIILNKSEYDTFQTNLEATDKAAKKAANKIAQWYASYLRIYYYNTLGEYENAIKLAQTILPELEKQPDEVLLKAKLNYILYGIYSEWNDAENATLYAKKAITFSEISGNKNMLSSAYSALAVCYAYKYEKTGNIKDLDAVVEMCQKAVALYHRFPGHISEYTYALSLLNLANYNLMYPVIKPAVRKEIESVSNEILRLTRNISNSQPVQTGALGILSNLAMKDNNILLSEQYLLKAEAVAMTQNPIYYYTLLSIVSDLAKLYANQRNFQKAYEYQTKTTEYNSLLYNENQAATAKKLEAQYQTQKREAEFQALTEKAASLKREKLLYIGLGIIGLAGAFFMFRSYHFKLRLSLESEKKLTTEKHEAEIQYKLEQEEKARLKAEQELLTLKQEQLQREVLANQLHLQHKNEVLQQLESKLSDKNINIRQVVKEEYRMDNEFEKARFRIQELHPDFFKNLNDSARQKLTNLDLKYCAYFYLGMETKQIAHLLNVEPKSVRMTKYRLKQKFNLNAETDLAGYLKNIV
ncbi:LuxR C-terminal-related transcriptional regulator [Sphingobacterium spiritivorum]|uniref:LuxR C-terminal-related transcriptional regulator n=1 Tax=Sphingobacterium spiritivorum TaxID=258 RepID=UPI001F2D8303|nr:LuxR C-terminal-related transcriptional regulator [Sphingobacterium spiritivorum]